MRKHALFWIETGIAIACLCLFFWWPYAIDLFMWHIASPVRGICWFLSLIYLAVVCWAPIKVDGTRLTDLF